MTKRNRTRTVFTLAAVAMAVLSLTANPANAGVISYVQITNDADCGISADNTYTHKLDFGTGSPGALINGVQFDAYNNADLGTLNFNRTVSSGRLSQHAGNGNHNVSGSLVDLMTDMYFNGNNEAGGSTTWTLSGLKGGATYQTRIYVRSWGTGGGSRVATIVFDPDGGGPISDSPGPIKTDDASASPPGFNGNDAYYINYEFTAVAGEDLVITVTQDGDNMSWHLYGLSNELVGLPFNASGPNPVDGVEDVPRDVVLSWQPGKFAAPVNGHKVYFSESFDDVNDATSGVAQDANSYAPAQRPDFGTTYYWRVDEVNAPPTSHIEFKGEVWQFTTEPVAYPIDGENITATASSSNSADEGPENTINGSGLDANDLHSAESKDMWLSSTTGPQPTWIQYEFDRVYKLHQMWVWNHNSLVEAAIGFGVKDATIEYSVDGATWTTLGTTHEFAQAPGAAGYAYNTTVELGGVIAKYVRITANSNWGGILTQYGLSEVRFLYIPLRAREPQPESGATDVDVDLVLSWRAGREAAEHDVYISTDEQAVIDSNVPVSIVTEAQDGPISLDLGETYYWKVNEVNEAKTPTMLEGDIWDFTTHEFFVVDDFEDYNDYPPDEIWATWLDGYGIPTNGATVGYPNPDWNQGEHYVETTIVHGGDQSMPFFYDNTGTAAYSEVERTFAVPQDWTKYGIKALALYFHGDPNNSVTEQMYVKLNGSKVIYDGDADNLTQILWQPWNIDLADFGVNLSSVTELSIGFERIGVAGGKGVVYFDDIRLLNQLVSVVGTFSVHPWTGDGDSGISSSKTYTHTGKFTGEGTDGEPFFAGNDVYFERDTNRSGTNWTLTGPARNVFGTTNSVNVAGDSAALARGFFYGDEDNNHPVLTLTGLVPDTEYVTTFYTVGFGGAGGRFVDITPGDNPGNPTRVDQNGAGSGNGQRIKYTYTATSTEMSFMFDALKTGDSWHHYAFSNEAVSPNLGNN